MNQPDPRTLARELQRVQRRAVAAADHDNVTPDEPIGLGFDLIRDIAAEGTVLRRRQLRQHGAGSDHQCPPSDARRIHFDPSFPEVGACNGL